MDDRGRCPALEVRNLAASYGKARVLHQVELTVPPSSVVALIGANGAGKSTLLRVVAGLVRPDHGDVIIDGAVANRMSAFERAKAGLCLIPEGRGIFRSLSVRENLELQIPPWLKSGDLSPALSAFPALKSRLSQVAGSLSGGEQQMLALSRAYLSEPKLILLDEVSLGLAPIVVDQIFASLAELASRSVSLLIVEQYVNRVLEISDFAYLLTQGEVSWSGPASGMELDAVIDAYLSGEPIEDVPPPAA